MVTGEACTNAINISKHGVESDINFRACLRIENNNIKIQTREISSKLIKAEYEDRCLVIRIAGKLEGEVVEENDNE